VEKALKGLIVMADAAPPRTHNLKILLSKVAAHYPAFKDLQPGIGKLDKFYIPARYPNGIEMEFIPGDSQYALETADQILSLAGDVLNE
jgi:HEPN domain-containing protein